VTTPTPNVFLFGAGTVASALASALRHAGVPVLGLWARRPDAVRTAAALSGVAGYSGPLPDLMSEADALIIAVRDEAISEVAGLLAASPHLSPRAVALHCSGGTPSAQALAPLAGRLRGLGTLHPLRAFTDARRAAIKLPETTFAVEGDPAAVDVATQLAFAIGSRPLRLTADDLPAYHAAAVLASNALVALLADASAVLGGLGLPRESALAALLPLAMGTLDNLSAVGLPKALTGPIMRGDAAVVARNLAALTDPDIANTYRVLAHRTIVLARERGTPEADLARVVEALGKG